MGNVPDPREELEALLHKLCDGRLDESDHERLAELLVSSEAACQRYIEFVDFQVSLEHCSYSLDRESDIDAPRTEAARLPELPEAAPPRATSGAPGTSIPIAWPQDELPAANGPAANSANSANAVTALNAAALASIRGPWWLAWNRPLWKWSGVAAAAVLLIALGFWFRNRETTPQPTGDLAVTPPRATTTAPSPTVSEDSSVYVARVVRATANVRWGDASAFDFFMRIRPGDRVDVTAGLVQLEFFSGAKIILHGPAAFMPTGHASGKLESGRLTGEVANGNFRLTTPAAEVIDLGTEFGVSVDATTGTDVFVFNGEVKVVSRPNAYTSPEVLNMTEGMAARIRSDGTADYELHAQPGEFARSFPKSERPSQEGELSLVDILSGGNGLGARLAGAVDPATGQLDRGDWRAQNGAGRRVGDGKFHPAGWHPLIDGLFIPPYGGKQVPLDSQGNIADLPPSGRVQVDALGQAVQLPPTGGVTWGPVWARRCDNDLRTAGEAKDFWGTNTLDGIVARLRAARLGIVALHPNAGITFDLRAVRFEQRRPTTEFRTTLANLDFSRWSEPKWAESHHSVADFRVFVDGALRYSRLGFGRDDGESEVVVPLSSKDRFLTLVSTDGDGSISFDHVVLIDPILTLEQQ